MRAEGKIWEERCATVHGGLKKGTVLKNEKVRNAGWRGLGGWMAGETGWKKVWFD